MQLVDGIVPTSLSNSHHDAEQHCNICLEAGTNTERFGTTPPGFALKAMARAFFARAPVENHLERTARLGVHFDREWVDRISDISLPCRKCVGLNKFHTRCPSFSRLKSDA
jgi:hypothetical protein